MIDQSNENIQAQTSQNEGTEQIRNQQIKDKTNTKWKNKLDLITNNNRVCIYCKMVKSSQGELHFQKEILSTCFIRNKVYKHSTYCEE